MEKTKKWIRYKYVVTDVATNEKIEFDKILDVGDYFNLSSTTIRRILSGHAKKFGIVIERMEIE